MAFNSKMSAEETRSWFAATPAELTQAGKTGLTPLAQLALHNNVEALTVLLDAGVNPNTSFPAIGYDRVVGAYRPKPGQWPLSVFAGFHGAAGTLALLLGRGGSVPAEHTALVLEHIAGGQPPELAASLVKTLLGQGDPLAKPEVGAEALNNAAAVGNQRVLELLLSAGVPITARRADGQTVTHSASGSRHPETLGWLLERGAPLNIKNKAGELPLAIALRLGAYETALTLLRAGSPSVGRLDLKNVERLATAVEKARAIQTPDGPAVDLAGLFTARAWEQIAELAEVGMSIEQSLSLNGKQVHGLLEFMDHAPLEAKRRVLPGVTGREALLLTVASKATNPDGLALLAATLALGDDLNQPGPDLRATVLGSALSANAPVEALEMILARGANLNGVKRRPSTAHSAAPHRSALEWLAQKGADFERVFPPGGTPIQLAVERGYDEGVLVLVKAGARLDVKDEKGRTPLERAMERGAKKEVIDALSAGSPKPTYRPPPPVRMTGRSELLHACARGDVDGVKRLIGRGAKPDARDFRGSTPLAVAAVLDEGAVIDALLELGAKPDTKTEDGLSPWALARLFDAKKAEKRLVAAGASTAPALLAEAQSILERYARLIDEDDLNGLAKAIDGGMDCDLPLLGGLTPMHRVIDANRDELLEVVIRSGADVELVAGDRTPLMRAAERGHLKLVERLLARHAKLNRVSDGWNAAGLAKRAGHEDVVKRLGGTPKLGEKRAPRKPAKPKGPKLERREGRVMVLVNCGFTDEDDDMPFWFDHDDTESVRLEKGAEIGGVADVLRCLSYGDSFADQAAAAIAKLKVAPTELFVLYDLVMVLKPGRLPEAWRTVPGIWMLDDAAYAGDFSFERTPRG
ncbi:MAG: ankyrin repeat domain-containing protein [Myxococcaceae bacterium]|nr:ankyrin repeat domain-containing protein [Myxococcaceae bacterium]